MTTRVYTYQNGGLPSDTSHQKGELTRMLKASLVTGTDTKQPAGWTLIYEDQIADRIVLQSQTVKSQLCYYEISYGTPFVIKASLSWDDVNKQLIGGITRYISRVDAWNGECFVIADERFCWFSANHAIGCFGDIDILTTDPSSIVFGSSSTNIDGRGINHLHGKINNLSDINGRALAVRAYNNVDKFFSISTNGANVNPTPYGDAQGASVVHQVELFVTVQRKLIGFLPHLLYCDKFLDTGEYIANGKRIFKSPLVSETGSLLFEVDEL